MWCTSSIPGIVGPEGKVIGVDTSERMLDELRSKVRNNKLDRLTLIRSDEYDFHLDRDSASFVFSVQQFLSEQGFRVSDSLLIDEDF